MLAFVLVHSPLVGPLTWRPVAELLRQRGLNAVVPVLASEGIRPPYWAHHAAAIAESLKGLPPTRAVVLVGHSGAGPFLPAARSKVVHPVAGYVFVDAGLPGPDGASRFDLFESREVVERIRASARGGLLSPWADLVDATDRDLQSLIPHASLRQQFMAELHPTPLAIYEEPLPVSPEWPDAPCAYLQLSEVYELSADQARRFGWPCSRLPGDHFHMLVAPDAVADTLIQLTAEMEAHPPGD